MAKRKSMGVNAVLNGIKTIFSVIFPLITIPYVTDVLTKSNFGKYNFSFSVMQYVAMFAALGINTYAIRECAKVRNDRAKLDQTASEIFTINVIATIASYAVLALVLLIPFFRPYRAAILILCINVVFTTLGCEWIYSAYEKYMYITVRSLITHVLSLVLLFVLVRKEDDVLPYCAVTVMATSSGNLLYLIGRRKYANITFRVTEGIKRHIKPIMTMFANTVTTSIYVSSDVLILRFLTSDETVASYSASAKIYTIVKNVLAAVITVSVPRLSSYWAKKDSEKFNSTCHRVFMALMVLGAPAMIGLAALSKNVILLVTKPEYVDATFSLQILSVGLLFSVFAWFYKSCILIPTGNEDKILRATVVASILNIGLNFALIPFLKQDAAALTTLIAEAICLGFAFHYGKKYYKLNIKLKDWLSVLIGCVLILITCICVPMFIHRNIFIVMVACSASVILYFATLFLFKNSVAVMGLKLVKKKLKIGA